MIRKTDPQAIAPYLKDASNYSGGYADEVLVPENIDELVEFLKTNEKPITISGAGTGVTAGRIPNSGAVISLERFNKIGAVENHSIRVEAAVTLKELMLHLQTSPSFYPPNPTESLASIGGTLATNASGSRSYKWGATRNYVLEAGIVLADGSRLHLARGDKITSPLQLERGKRIHFPNVIYQSPDCKNAAGYFVHPGMDWLDLFIGSDGTLGIITDAKLRLLDRPADFISGVLFFEEEDICWKLVESIRATDDPRIDPCSLEYFDQYSLERLRTQFTNIPDRALAALFFEQDVRKKEDYDPLLDTWYEFLSGQEVLLDDSWFAQTEKDVQKFHEFRHRIPVLLNEENSRLNRVKIGTDMAVPARYLPDMMRFYRQCLSKSGIDYVVFGHLGDNHLHINLLPEENQINRARETYDELVNQILLWKGTVSAEHGIGKLKKEYFARMLGEEFLLDLRKIKSVFDPDWKLGQGNIL
jgi:D-lactate dehydrogenase (cytochrome)